MKPQQPLTHAELRQFSGGDAFYRHSLHRRVIYSAGVQHLAERAGAYWLIDAIASYLGTDVLDQAIEHDDRLRWLQFWRLAVAEDRSASLSCRADSDMPAVVEQSIEFTDFPLDTIDVWVGYDGEHWTLYLPSEH